MGLPKDTAHASTAHHHSDRPGRRLSAPHRIISESNQTSTAQVGTEGTTGTGNGKKYKLNEFRLE
ncbi:hypothetical protein PSPTOT1_0787 [Pseudomonas syringae pv. tomato T1]|nr:hypothetical protein PSPTOT1_0787 [Pseudomonas syringae pv. tomato T1]